MKLVGRFLSAKEGNILLAKREVERGEIVQGDKFARIDLDQADMRHCFGDSLWCTVSLVPLALFHRSSSLYAEGGQESWSPSHNALLIRSLLEDLLQAFQETVGLAGIRTEHVVCHVGRLLVCHQVDALIAHDEQMIGSQVDLMQDGDLCIS